ncbi:MAG: C10 family peptidase [Bacteroidales bacterium]|jgi:hypothetical protein|nr:C10 family peptidase [Bacteroidales bacterium]
MKITKKIKATLLLLLSIWSVGVLAQQVSVDMAQNLADKFIQKTAGNTHKSYHSVAQIYTEHNAAGLPLYYVIEYDGGGFVIMAADQRVKPVLAYSPNESFYGQNDNAGAQFWLNAYSAAVEYAVENIAVAEPKIATQWEQLLNPSAKQQKAVGDTVAPLLTSTWNQDKFYNWYCPMVTNSAAISGYDNRVPNGCVAVTMSQIMYYHRYPRTGNGNSSYTSPYGFLEANYGQTTYDYESMQDKATTYSGAMATLISHAGISVKMGYGANGSGAQSADVVSAMRQYFLYDNSISMIARTSYTDATWFAALKSNLDQGLPVYYAACLVDTAGKRDGCHAWVCDGYADTSYLHFNWGWGGSQNGYYSISLNNGMNEYTERNQAIINIKPRNYTDTITHQTLTATVGSLSDGSNYKDYTAGKNVTWLISPQNIRNINAITFTVSSCQLGVGDTVNIYSGNSANGTLVAQLYEDVVAGTSYVVNASEAFITFSATNTGKGFVLNYAVTNYQNEPSCYSSSISVPKMTTATGTFATANPYNDDATCNWIIAPPSATEVSFIFTKFDLAEGDRVEIYRSGNVTNVGSLDFVTIGFDYFTKDKQPTLNQIYTVDGQYSQSINVRLVADNKSYASGFEIKWGPKDSLVTPDNIENVKLGNLNIYPNPAKNIINVDFVSLENQNVEISVFDVLGKQLYINNIQTFEGEYQQKIDISAWANGLYVVKIMTPRGILVQKINKE